MGRKRISSFVCSVFVTAIYTINFAFCNHLCGVWTWDPAAEAPRSYSDRDPCSCANGICNSSDAGTITYLKNPGITIYPCVSVLITTVAIGCSHGLHLRLVCIPALNCNWITNAQFVYIMYIINVGFWRKILLSRSYRNRRLVFSFWRRSLILLSYIQFYYWKRPAMKPKL